MSHHIIQGDCLAEMAKLPNACVDMILCDLPYGTTACQWDSVIPFPELWAQYKRLIKPNCAIVLTASQPFTSFLVCSNPQWFKHEWIWEKDGGSNFAGTKYAPMKEHESVLVFGDGRVNYYPIPQERIGSRKGKVTTSVYNGPRAEDNTYNFDKTRAVGRFDVAELRCPRSIQRFTRERGLHPTQKPVALFEYLIKTYTQPGAIVLDNCAGSGTTGVAAKNTQRHCILIEKEAQYASIIKERLA